MTYLLCTRNININFPKHQKYIICHMQKPTTGVWRKLFCSKKTHPLHRNKKLDWRVGILTILLISEICINPSWHLLFGFIVIVETGGNTQNCWTPLLDLFNLLEKVNGLVYLCLKLNNEYLMSCLTKFRFYS